MNNPSNVMLGLITGAAIGTIAAILYAPERGIDIRRKIADTAQTALDAVARAAEQLKGRAELTALEEHASLESRLNAIITHAHSRPDELIPLLEMKLVELKKNVERIKNKQPKSS